MKNNINTAGRIAENHIPGIQRVVQLDIVIDGKIIKHFKHFQLKQSVRKHHRFELTLAHDSLEKIQDHTIEEAQNFLGKRLTITFKYKDAENESPERTFVGVITKVAYSQEKMSLGNIVLKGFSPTILMDSSLHTQSFGGEKAVNTSIIANEIIKNTLSSAMFDYSIDTQNQSYINYNVQYKETYYNYLSRLAEAYGEQFYYDGNTLYFGRLPSVKEQALRLIYGSNVSDISIELQAIPAQPQFFGYNSSNHTKLKSASAEINHLGELARRAYQINQTINKGQGLISPPLNPNLPIDLDYSQRSAAGSAAVEVFTVSGSTSIPFMYPGCVADIEMRKQDSNQTSYFTKLMITEVSHDVDAKGFYSGSFEAIAEGTGFLPKPEFTIPVAEPQIATVISNTDPLNQGRIQVRFDWQINDSTHFIRVMSPDAGGTGVVDKNRGFVAIPEVGDQVMVAFEYHHPDFPFAMGGMFHGQVGLGGGVNNQLRSIQTKSGIRILMNDDEKSLTIIDPSGNTYFMDGEGNITITAPKNMNFIAGENLNIQVGRDMKTTVGNDHQISIQNDHQFSSRNYKQTVNEDKTVNVTGNLKETTSTTTHNAKNGDILLQSSGVAKMLGKIDAKVNKG